MSGPIWIQTGCKDYQQTTPVGEESLPQDSTKIVMLDKTLTSCICMIGNFSIYLSSAVFFFKSSLKKTMLSEISSVSNSLDPNKARHFIGPDLDNWLQNLSADDHRRRRIVVPGLYKDSHVRKDINSVHAG